MLILLLLILLFGSIFNRKGMWIAFGLGIVFCAAMGFLFPKVKVTQSRSVVLYTERTRFDSENPIFKFQLFLENEPATYYYNTRVNFRPSSDDNIAIVTEWYVGNAWSYLWALPIPTREVYIEYNSINKDFFTKPWIDVNKK